MVFAVLSTVPAAFMVHEAVRAGERLSIEDQGKVAVDGWFWIRLRDAAAQAHGSPDFDQVLDRLMQPYYATEAARIVRDGGGDAASIAAGLQEAIRNHWPKTLVLIDRAAPGIRALPEFGALPAMLGSLVLLMWGVMIVLQSEGLDFDLARRRHPMWEWLFSHPAPPAAIFIAELLAPLAANPVYWGAPLLPGLLYAPVYGVNRAVLAVILVGVPIALAAACLGKALDIAVMLRPSPKSRGAIFGLMSWCSATIWMLLVFGSSQFRLVALPLAKALAPLTAIPWPWLGLFLGQRADGTWSFFAGVLACWIAAAIVIAAAILIALWGARNGLESAATVPRPRSQGSNGSPFAGTNPLFRKEILWFLRDRSAVVQAILLPLSLGALQVLNLHALLATAQGGWTFICGIGIIFGTYFLTIVGPRSLASEGAALWIALTWPQGLETLLKTKARLWGILASAIVTLVFAFAIWRSPGDFWKIALVAIAWHVFARSLADKAVTLTTVTSESGEVQRVSRGQRWAATLGTFAFSIGVFTEQWGLAIAGVVYSIMTAAAMWQNFRAHLPYFYDPWSERLPEPPTLMHAMIAISTLIELGSVLSAGLVSILGKDMIAVVAVMSYGTSALVVALALVWFFHRREVPQSVIWLWPEAVTLIKLPRPLATCVWLGVAVAVGLILGLFGSGYVEVLRHVSITSELLRVADAARASIPHFEIAYLVMGVLIAPVAEEYLFRGLLYRSLDKEWGGWRAVAGSAAFFAAYHPMLAWLPVGLLGAVNALLFKRSGRLMPAIVVHMVYNFIVLQI
jgi:membrane protease YdiL (CAAX protease family)